MAPGTLTNSSGTLTYTLASGDQYTYTRDANALIGAYTGNIPLAVTAVTDGEVSSAGTLPTLSPTGASLRYGNLKLSNAYGSELLDLPVAVEAQYWNGSYYTANTADSCTAFPASSIIMGNYLQNLNACETHFSSAGSLAMSGGVITPDLKLTAPGSGNTGSVDLTLNIGSIASGNTCTTATGIPATAANKLWFGTNPTARATFGIYKGNSKFIYIRELY
jgi:MSHA biogenesis protein MshQ